MAGSHNQRRKPDPNQYVLVPDPAKAEDKSLVRSVTRAHVATYCEREGLRPPTPAEWSNAQEVLTYMIHLRSERGIFPSMQTIADRAFAGPRSKPVAERAVTLLRRLGVVSSARNGRNASEYFLHLDWLAQIRSDAMPQRVLFEPSSIRQNEPASIRQIGAVDPSIDGSMTDRMTDRKHEIDGSAIRGINQNQPENQPPPQRPSQRSDDWTAAVVAVDRCGVNQSGQAVSNVRAAGGAPGDVEAIVEYWQTHRDGWPEQFAIVNLFNRFRRWEPGQAVAAGWEPFTPEYASRLSQQRRDARTVERMRERRTESAPRAERFDFAAAAEALGNHDLANRLRADRQQNLHSHPPGHGRPEIPRAP